MALERETVLAYVVAGACVLRYDNEAGKGDHKHIGEQQISLLQRLLEIGPGGGNDGG